MKGAPDMNSLVAVGTGAAWGFSVVATFAPTLLPDQGASRLFRGRRGDRDADPARPLAGGARQGPHLAAIRRL
jgi:hypothetical protein